MEPRVRESRASVVLCYVQHCQCRLYANLYRSITSFYPSMEQKRVGPCYPQVIKCLPVDWFVTRVTPDSIYLSVNCPEVWRSVPSQFLFSSFTFFVNSNHTLLIKVHSLEDLVSRTLTCSISAVDKLVVCGK